MNLNYLNILRKYEIPLRGPDKNDWETRVIQTSELNVWPMMEITWIHQLAQFIGHQTVLEVGAGSGHLSVFLKQFGVNIVATDMNPKNKFVEKLSAVDAVRKYEKDILLCSWPEYNSEFLTDAIRHVTVHKVIYLGEREGGCTGSSSFFDLFSEEMCIDIPNYESIYDRILIGNVARMKSLDSERESGYNNNNNNFAISNLSRILGDDFNE